MGGFVDVDVDVLRCWLCGGGPLKVNMINPTDKAEKGSDQEGTL
jgi:hypothetical protein